MSSGSIQLNDIPENRGSILDVKACLQIFSREVSINFALRGILSLTYEELHRSMAMFVLDLLYSLITVDAMMYLDHSTSVDLLDSMSRVVLFYVFCSPLMLL